MKTTTLPLQNSMNRSLLRAFLLIPFVLACFALSPQARATCQEGCLTNQNTVLGENALISNTTGLFNTAIGFYTLFDNTSGQNNTATGYSALTSNTTGVNNTGTGGGALLLNTTGSGNTATGLSTLPHNTAGDGNTATGDSALYNNTTGRYNTAHGAAALDSNTTGSNNIALGVHAGANLTMGSDNIDIGSPGNHGDSAKIRIGTTPTHKDTFIAGISGVTVPTGVAVLIDNSGHLGTTTSSARFKEAVKPMNKASEAILALNPVTFRYKQEIDPEGIPQFGLVAEEVEKVNPALLVRDQQGKPYSVRYEAVNAMLLNEFLKEHRKVQEQETAITQLKSSAAKQGATITRQQKQIEALTAGLEKVSAQIELSKSAPQTVLNNQ